MPKPKLKIGLVLDDTLDTDDGVQQYVLTLGKWLSSRGHEVHYLAGETKSRNLPQLHSLAKNVSVKYNHNYLSLPLPARKSKIKKLLRTEHFDVLHVQMPYSPFLAGRIINLAPKGTKIVGTFHILPYSKWTGFTNRLLGVCEQRSLRKFDQIVSVSPAAQEFSRKAFKIDSTVIPNAVATKRYVTARRSFKHKGGPVNITFLGRLVPRKGCQTLLEAVNLLSEKHGIPKFSVTICGAGQMMASLIKYTNDNNLARMVKFVGYVPESDKPARLASADIAVFPSSGGESFGIVLVEAMASGKAVVLAGENPGYESVLGGQPELLFDAKDPAALAAKLEHYLLDPELRREHAAWCKIRAAEFDVSRIGPQLESIYREIESEPKTGNN